VFSSRASVANLSLQCVNSMICMVSYGVEASGQCSKSKSSVPFKWVLGLQKIPQGKQPFKT
jgi:hypothetical protein